MWDSIVTLGFDAPEDLAGVTWYVMSDSVEGGDIPKQVAK